MRTSFYKRLSPVLMAVVDLVEYGEGFLITRINVPKQFRGQGVGSELLQQLINEADKEEARLYLTISPSDGLNFEQLESWYSRYGFKRFAVDGFMLRQPKLIGELY